MNWRKRFEFKKGDKVKLIKKRGAYFSLQKTFIYTVYPVGTIFKIQKLVKKNGVMCFKPSILGTYRLDCVEKVR